MKKSIFTMSLLALLLCGCQNSSDNNRGLEYETLNVNFKGTLSDNSWREGSEIGIFASCTRDNQQDVRMSSNVNAKYVVTGEETDFFLQATDGDAIIANASDHNFRFYAYYPYASGATNATALSAQVSSVQQYAAGIMSYGLYVADKQVSTVIPMVELDFEGVFSIVELYLPNDILDEDGESVVRRLKLKPAVGDNFNGFLADKGVYNMETGMFTSDGTVQAKEIELDFGEDGLALTDPFTKVSLAVAPFTVQEGGMEVVVYDLSEWGKTVTILSKEKDEGTVLAAGEVLSQYLTSENDGVIPVTFPVRFPVNVFTGGAGTGNVTAALHPEWPTNGTNTGTAYWRCEAQPQAYGQWYWASDYWTLNSSPVPFAETINSGTNVSSPGVKGIWTGDYMEFVLPVRKFTAGTSLTIKFPLLTRLTPIFWNIEYLDGEQWKCNRSLLEYHGVSMEATFAINTVWNTGFIVEHTMVFSEAISSGYIKIRLTCADGSVCINAADTPVTYTAPHTNAAGTAFDGPFYFYMEGSDVKALSFSID